MGLQQVTASELAVGDVGLCETSVASVTPNDHGGVEVTVTLGEATFQRTFAADDLVWVIKPEADAV
jgi:hypothetical protein